MKPSETDSFTSSRSVFSSLLNLAGGKARKGKGLGRLQLFSMGGTFGRGSIKHCDTWEFEGDNPENAAVRQEIQDIAQRRRKEATDRLRGEKKKGFYDFIIR